MSRTNVYCLAENFTTFTFNDHLETESFFSRSMSSLLGKIFFSTVSVCFNESGR